MRFTLSPDEDPNDTGTTAGGIVERDLNIKVATVLKTALERCGQTVIFDTSITYKQRVAAANADGTDVLVACAHNASSDPNAEGAMFVFCNQSAHAFGKQAAAAQNIGTELVKAGIVGRWTTYDERVYECCAFNKDTVYCEFGFQTNARDVATFNKPTYPYDAAEAAARGLAATYGFAYVPDADMRVAPARPWPAIYLQRDARWAGHQLGSAPNATIGDVGCYLTALAVMANYYGTPVTPGLLNDLLTLRKIYEQGDLMPDNALQQAYPGMTMQAVHDYTGTPADLGILGPVAADPTLTAILEVDFDAGLGNGVASHFVTFDHMAGQRVYVLDPWYGDGIHADDVAWHYGDAAVTIQKVVVYRGTPKAPNPVPTPKPTPTKVLILRDMDARSKPEQGAVIQPVQVVHTGATLQLTGRFTTHWISVIAGGREVWVLRSNTKPII